MASRTVISGLCQLLIEDGQLVRRTIEFGGEHPVGLKGAPYFEKSIAFQNSLFRQHKITGVLEIGELKRNPHNQDFFYNLSGFQTDLYQLAREQKLSGGRLPRILFRILEVLLAVKERCQRTHGALSLESVLVRDADAKDIVIALTDFLPTPTGGVTPGLYEKQDLLGLGRIIAAAAIIHPEEENLDFQNLFATSLPEMQDRDATRRLGDGPWAALREMAEDLLSPGGPLVMTSLEKLQGEMSKLAGPGFKTLVTPPRPPATPPTPAKGTQTLDFPQPADRRYGDAPFNLEVSATSGLPVILSILSGQECVTLSGKVMTILRAGKVSIQAAQLGNANFQPAAAVVREFTIGRRPQKITFEPPPDRSLEGPPLELSASADSGLPVHFAVVSGPATIVGSLLKPTGAGVIEIKAAQRGDVNHEPTEVVRSFRVAGRSQTIEFAAIPHRALGTAPFAVNATASSRLPVTFAVVSGPARIAGNFLTLEGAGTVTIRASQPGNQEYAPAPEVLRSFEVIKADLQPQTILLAQPRECTFGDPPIRLVATSDRGLPIIFSIESGPARVTGDEVTLAGAGQVTVRAYNAGNDSYQPAEAKRTFNVAKAKQIITFAPLPRRMAVGETITVQASARSGLPVTLSVPPGKGELENNKLRLAAAGNWAVKAVQAGDANFLPAEATQILTVEKGAQEVIFEALPAEISMGDTLILNARATPSSLPVSLSVVSGPAVLTGNQLLARSPGEVRIRATQNGDANYLPATEALQTVQVGKKSQRISWESLPRDIFVGDSVTLAASSDCGLPVSFRVIRGPATLEGDHLTATGAGMLEIEAFQEGDDHHKPASNPQTQRVTKRPQEIQFEPISDKKLTEPIFTVEVEATSRLPVRLSVHSGRADIRGNQITLKGRGVVEIEAAQDGDASYEAAEPVVQSFNVTDPRRTRMLLVGGVSGGIIFGAVAVLAWWLFAPRPPELGAIPGQELELGGEQRVELPLKVPKFQGSIEALNIEAAVQPADVVKLQTNFSSDRWVLVLTPEKRGKATVALKAKDGRGLLASNTFEVTVTPKREAPIIGRIRPPPSLREGEGETMVDLPITVQGEFVAIDKLTVQPTVNPSGVVEVRNNFSGNRWRLALQPLGGGTAQVTVQVKDNRGLSSQPVSFAVRVLPKPRPPEFGELGTIPQLQQGKPRATLDLPLKVQAPWVSLSNVVITPKANPSDVVGIATTYAGDKWHLILSPRKEGTAHVTITARDERDLSSERPAQFDVQVLPGEAAPSFGDLSSIPPLEVEGPAATLDLPLEVQAPLVSLTKVTLTASADPPDVLSVSTNFVKGGWQLRLNPRREGTAQLTIVATDQRRLSSEAKRISIKVNPKPLPPALTIADNIPTLEVDAGERIVKLNIQVQTQLLSLAEVKINTSTRPEAVLKVHPNFTGSIWEMVLEPVKEGVADVAVQALGARGLPSKTITFPVTVNPKPIPPEIVPPTLPELEAGGAPQTVDLSVRVQTPQVKLENVIMTPIIDSSVATVQATYTGSGWQLVLNPLKEGDGYLTINCKDERGLPASEVKLPIQVRPNQTFLTKLGELETIAVMVGFIKNTSAKTPQGKKAQFWDTDLPLDLRDQFKKAVPDLENYFNSQAQKPNIDFRKLLKMINDRH